MTETHTTNSDTFQAQYPLALAALANHMLAHQLPAPTSIDIVDASGDPEIVLRIPGNTHTVWVSSVAVDRERNEDTDFGGIDAYRTTWWVRLPDLGFRFTLIAYRAVPNWRFAS